MACNSEGKRTSLENFAGQVTTTAWDCCHKVSETESDGSTTTWAYDDEGRMIATSRLIPLDMTNVTWLTTCYRYDALGRLVSTSADFEPTTEYTYDTLGNRIATTRTVGRGDPTAPQEEFVPQFDDDGNQTLVQTSTYIWQIQYNGENRPILWSCIQSNNIHVLRPYGPP